MLANELPDTCQLDVLEIQRAAAFTFSMVATSSLPSIARRLAGHFREARRPSRAGGGHLLSGQFAEVGSETIPDPRHRGYVLHLASLSAYQRVTTIMTKGFLFPLLIVSAALVLIRRAFVRTASAVRVSGGSLCAAASEVYRERIWAGRRSGPKRHRRRAIGTIVRTMTLPRSSGIWRPNGRQTTIGARPCFQGHSANQEP